MTFWIALLTAGQLALLPSSLYLLFLTVVGAFYHRPRRPPASTGLAPKTRFAILVPAHNEELLLPGLLDSLSQMSYPSNHFQTFVVADNCSDATAAIARSHGVEVFERQDNAHRGKGHALRWLLEQVRNAGREYDACVFLDADCQVSANFLDALDRRFQGGSQVVQSYYTVADPFKTEISALRFIALVLKHYVRPLGRARLKLSCGLFGTGMGFKKSVLAAREWESFALTEDIEYFLQLAERGVPVEFAPEAIVWSEMPATLREAKSQNLRWERGRLQMACKYGPRLLLDGILHGDWKKVDAVAEQAIPPLSIAVTVALALLIGALLTDRAWLVVLSISTTAALLGHVFIGLASAHVPGRTYRCLLHVPRYVLWKLFVYFLALIPGKREWIRTQRS